MNTRSQLKIALIVLLACCIAYLVYERYQRSQAQQARLQQDTRRIETMFTEDNAGRP